MWWLVFLDFFHLFILFYSVFFQLIYFASLFPSLEKKASNKIDMLHFFFFYSRAVELIKVLYVYVAVVCVHAQFCLTLCNLLDCSPPGSSVPGISQAKIPECVAISYSRGSSPLRDRTLVSYIGRWILYHLTTWEAPNKHSDLVLMLLVRPQAPTWRNRILSWQETVTSDLMRQGCSGQLLRCHRIDVNIYLH